MLALAVAWFVITAQMAHSHLEEARAQAHQLRAQVAAGDLGAARTTAADIARHAARAHRLTTDPLWTLAAHIPRAGDPVRSVRGITAALDMLGRDAIPELVAVGHELASVAGRTGSDGINLAALASASPALDRAQAAVDRALSDVQTLPAATWLPGVDAGRQELLTQLKTMHDMTATAELGTRIVLPMLVADEPQRYFVAFQNNAEARGTGGLPGAFAILTAERGRLQFQRFESDRTLEGVSAQVSLGADYAHLYQDAGTTTLFVNGNLSPHFPYAAQIWASMWKRHSGQTVDGVIAIDPAVLSYILAVTGPADLPDGSQVTAGNVVELTQRTAYSKFAGDRPRRQEYLLDIARAATAKITGADAAMVALMKAGAKAARERRLLAWSADPQLQADLERTPVAGIIPETSAPYVGLSIVNEGGNKLDYYLDRSLSWRRTGCGDERDVIVTIELGNDAPAGGLPADTVTARHDQPGYPVKPGDNRLLVGYFATAGAQMNSVTVDGQPDTARVGDERGHPVFTVDVELPRGTTRTVVLNLTEPTGTGPPIVLRQPLVRPLTVDIEDVPC